MSLKSLIAAKSLCVVDVDEHVLSLSIPHVPLRWKKERKKSVVYTARASDTFALLTLRICTIENSFGPKVDVPYRTAIPDSMATLRVATSQHWKATLLTRSWCSSLFLYMSHHIRPLGLSPARSIFPQH